MQAEQWGEKKKTILTIWLNSQSPYYLSKGTEKYVQVETCTRMFIVT